jgi:hypothetical protein
MAQMQAGTYATIEIPFVEKHKEEVKPEGCAISSVHDPKLKE